MTRKGQRSWYRFDYLDESLALREWTNSSRARTRAPRKTGKDATAAGKTTRAYNAHSYPTKVPAEAIEPYIARFTSPGDIILDPFCGSGMTGLAALRLGRRAVLSDLSPLATHLAYNHTTPCDHGLLRETWRELRDALRTEEIRHYGVRCDACRRTGILRYTIWSDVYGCPSCHTKVRLWDSGTDQKRGIVSKTLQCPACGNCWRKSASSRVRVEPAWIVYACACAVEHRQRAPTTRERQEAIAFPKPSETLFVPDEDISSDREMYRRSALHLHGIRSVRDFYTTRNLSALATLWAGIKQVSNARVRTALAFAFTNTAWHGTRMRRFNARGGHRPLTGTLYIPQLSSEANIFEVFDHKVRQLTRFYSELEDQIQNRERSIRLSSAADLSWIPDASIDYVFTDPPFGSNIFYADCNIISESWLGSVTDVEAEAVVNRSKSVDRGGKTRADYKRILECAFQEIHRVLKPGHWATVVFQSSDGRIWKTIEEAAEGAGFRLQSANMLDKVQQSMKGYKGRNGGENVASFDIVLQLRKPKGGKRQKPRLRRLEPTEAREYVLNTISRHLATLQPRTHTERTLPFLYSLAVRALLNARASVSGFSMEMLRSFLASIFEERSGRWYAPEDSGFSPQLIDKAKPRATRHKTGELVTL